MNEMFQDSSSVNPEMHFQNSEKSTEGLAGQRIWRDFEDDV
jgi:hypothetical protein